MLPLCSTTTCSSHSQMILNDGFRNRTQKLFDVRCVTGDSAVLNSLRGVSLPGVSVQKEVVNSLHSEFLGSDSLLSNEWRYSTGKLHDSNFIDRELLKYVEDSTAVVSQEEVLPDTLADNTNALLESTSKEPFTNLDNVTDSGASVPEAFSLDTDSLPPSTDGSENVLSQMTESVGGSFSKGESALNSSVDGVMPPSSDGSENVLSQMTESVGGSISKGESGLNSSVDGVMPPSSDGPENVLSQMTESIGGSISKGENALNSSVDGVLPPSTDGSDNVLSQMNESVGASISKGENALNSSVDDVTSTITGLVKDSNEAVKNLTSKVFSSVDQTGELTRNKLSNLPGELKEASSKAGFIALDLLRKTIVVVEDSLIKGTKFAYYSYESSKEFLPPEIQNGLTSFEERASEISRPVGMAFMQVYSAIEGLERSLGLDPSDPIVPFIIFLGTSSSLWAVYWVLTYSGYAGDLSPKSAFELLMGKDNAVLIDVRPEDLRERDGIPDLRRTARFRYADVSLPKVDGSLRKMMKSSRDLDDVLLATVIRNLKNVRDRSKVIVMDADGSRAKGIARCLKKLGIKRPYVLQGGFQSWAKQGLRVKELKPETAITILNEEAEAILEELSPTPVQLLGVGVGSVAALYALIEWEKTLQLIGVLAIGQIIYSRLASYEDPEDFRNDIRLLLSPVRLGAEAVSWAAGKAETNGNGLPLSPSSSDVQSRVLQAAAKHESQPSDAEGSQDNLMDSTSENVDASEA